MIVIDGQCVLCKHYRGGPGKGPVCAASPEYPGIPQAIFDEDADHRQPYPGDHGIRWEPREPGMKHPLDEESSEQE